MGGRLSITRSGNPADRTSHDLRSSRVGYRICADGDEYPYDPECDSGIWQAEHAATHGARNRYQGLLVWGNSDRADGKDDCR